MDQNDTHFQYAEAGRMGERRHRIANTDQTQNAFLEIGHPAGSICRRDEKLCLWSVYNSIILHSTTAKHNVTNAEKRKQHRFFSK